LMHRAVLLTVAVFSVACPIASAPVAVKGCPGGYSNGDQYREDAFWKLCTSNGKGAWSTSAIACFTPKDVRFVVGTELVEDNLDGIVWIRRDESNDMPNYRGSGRGSPSAVKIVTQATASPVTRRPSTS
ncbi:hypothetical protein PFISCL1PPCAC_27846, partial [Pristionchus fissidentatus]